METIFILMRAQEKKKHENGKHVNATVIEHVHDSHLGLFEFLSN